MDNKDSPLTLKIIEALHEINLNPILNVGICDNLIHYLDVQTFDAVGELLKDRWDKFSGCTVYPIPVDGELIASLTGFRYNPLNAKEEAFATLRFNNKLWFGEQGNLRREALGLLSRHASCFSVDEEDVLIYTSDLPETLKLTETNIGGHNAD